MRDDIIYKNWLKTAPTGLNAGLTIFKKIKNTNEYILLIGCNYYNGKKQFELLGGRYDLTDKTALHTAVREFIEELFNIKLNIQKIDDLVKKLIINNHIINNLTINSLTSVSYFANFKTLELIYNYVFNNIYEVKTLLNLSKFIAKRNKDYLTCVKSDGLYEIKFITFVYLSKVHTLKMRNFCYKILDYLKKKLKFKFI